MNDALVTFLKAVIPFSLLPQRLLGSEGDFFSTRHLAAGEEILAAGTSPDAACVVRSGSLEAMYDQCLPLTLLPGDMLGWEAALPEGQGSEGRGTGLWEARAAEASEVILIPLDVLARLMADELFVRALTARSGGLAAAAERAKGQACRPGPDPFLRLRVGGVTCPAPVFVDSAMSVAQAARVMALARATSALVRAGDLSNSAVLGILTERDVLVKVVAAGENAEELPVTQVMTPGLVTAGPDELLIEAFSRMVHHGIRRLVLLDESGAPAGVLGERDMLSARGESPLALAAEIAGALAPGELTRTFERLHRMAGRSVAEGIASDAVGRLISEMHDRILCRAWEMALTELGPAPAPHCVLVLGSQGRREQFLATDQDLALVYEGSDGGSGPELAAWFEGLGVRLTQMLLDVGFPPCKNRIMLDNPDWRRSLDSWLDLFDSIADRPDAEGVLKASLLADMRGVQVQGAGDGSLNVHLREAMTRRLRKSPILLKLMAREAVRFSPPLGLFGSFSLKKDAEGRGVLDLKRGGVFPITQGVKTLAVDHGLAETGTCARLRLLHRSGALSVPLAEGLCDAYGFLQTLRMRTQAAQLRQGKPLTNDIRPEILGAMERERLRASFKLTAEFQSLLFEKYSLRMLG